MIQAQELRIGNWVQSSGGKEPKQITVEDFWSHYDNQDKKDRFYYYEYIPLTPEILLACGFAQGIDQKWRIWDNDSFYIYGSNGYYAPYVMPELKYLHQLQNLYFALCGQELSYSPNKVK